MDYPSSVWKTESPARSSSRMRTRLQRVRTNSFVKHNAIYWTASLLVSVINYLYYPILGRLMAPAAFGETQTIISFFTQAAVVFQVISLVGVGVITKYQDEAVRDKLNAELSRLALFLSFMLLIGTIVCSPMLKSYFHFSSITPFYALAACLMVNVPLSFANSYLQGHKLFGKLSVVNVLGSSAKILFAVALVLSGLHAFGAIGGLVIAQLISLGYSLYVGRGIRHFIATNLHIRKLQLRLIKPELPYAAVVLVTSVTTNLLLSFDILVVKHYFSPTQAGLYTGISIISNIVYFVSGPFASVLIPSVKPGSKAQTNGAIIKRSMLLTIAIGGAATALFVLMPHLVVTLLLGARYAQYATYLRGLSLALFAMSLANLLIYYHIGLRNFSVAPIVLIGLIATLVMLAHWHATMGLVVRDLLSGAVLLLVLLIGLTTRYQISGKGGGLDYEQY